MEITLNKPLITKIVSDSELSKNPKNKLSLSHLKVKYEKNNWYRSDSETEVSLFHLTDEVINFIFEFAKSEMNELKKPTYKSEYTTKFLKSIVLLIGTWNTINENYDKAKISDVKRFTTYIQTFLNKKTQGRLIFKRDYDGNMNPYMIYKVVYNKARISDSLRIPPNVDIHFSYLDESGKKQEERINFYPKDVKDLTLQQIFMKRDFFLENTKLYENYKKEIESFQTFKDKVGLQVYGSGHSKSYSTKEYDSSRWWYNYSNKEKYYPLVVEGINSTLIIDNPESEERDKSVRKEDNFWSFSWDIEESEEVNLNESDEVEVDENKDTSIKFKTYEVPQHLYLICFNKNTHQHCIVHHKNLEVYKYDKTIGSKLILPEEHRELLDLLVYQTDDIMEDIVKGKTGGIIVCCTGPAGTGKTLTAEVYSEVVERPLYSIQSSQLGLTVEDLEKNLTTVLSRATRWKAVLLIDEADVYIRERGNDVQQNAMVGVFLRVLEYYKGILFFTSNAYNTNGDIVIDDAIISRCVAHLKYKIPTGQYAIDIWKVLTENYKIDVTDKEIKRIAEKYEVSGRSIKFLCKLGGIYVKKKDMKFNLELVDKIIKFQGNSDKTEIKV